jgi:hypothetical protein
MEGLKALIDDAHSTSCMTKEEKIEMFTEWLSKLNARHASVMFTGVQYENLTHWRGLLNDAIKYQRGLI